jgi:two-component system, NtrC family, C4-dicarboxylate transport sensor histidine kinase DctB
LKKNIYIFIIITILFTISMLIVIVGSSYIHKKEVTLYHEKYENLSLNFEDKITSLIEKKKNATLVLTLSLAENEEVKSMFESELDVSLLERLSFKLRENTDFKNVWFQLISKEGYSIYRSWSDKKNDRLSDIREDVRKMIIDQKSDSTISIGHYDMTFKSMVPIYKNNKFVGILESITHFNSISRGIKSKDNVEPIIVVDKKFTKQLKENAFTNIFIQDHYISNIEANKDFLKLLDSYKLTDILTIKKYRVVGNYLIINVPIVFNNEKLGSFLLFKKLADIDISDIKEFKTHAYWYLILAILLLCVFLSFIGYYLYTKELKNLYLKLDKSKEELHLLNKNLQEIIKKEVLKSNEKNKILFQQSKMAAMGEMIENIAHQWRQPLSVITISASAIKLKKEYGILEDKEHLESLESIINTSNYLSNTIDDFRNFFSPNKNKNKFSSVELIDKSFTLLRVPYKKSSISIIKNIEEHKIFTYENELIQVLINILNNAKDELIKIEDIKKRYVFIDLYKKDENIIIEIKDNAGGIDENIIDRIFEPYFTTKHKRNGTGVGLYMCEEIITRHMKGSIKVKNIDFKYEKQIFKGALFKLSIPIK